MTGYTDGLGLTLNDLYPGMTVGGDTSTAVVPDSNDQESLQESSQETAKKATGETSNKMIFLAIIGTIILIIIMGGVK